ATKLEIPYYSSMSKKKIDTTNKKALIAVSVVGGLLIVGIIVFAVLGFTSSTLFHPVATFAIKFDGNLLSQPWFSEVNYISYSHTGD
ncbi:MAG: hypothetical protein MJ195_03420, partial [Mycoplasmoidaceae bacterium]|nr:hypothetical protein [Mycoplasmoidaceae bacterium]